MCVLPASLLRGPARLRIGSGFGPLGSFSSSRRPAGPSWWAKYRLPDGTQVKRKVGPAWTGRGRPAAGYFTKRLAEDWLRDTLEEVRREWAVRQADGGSASSDRPRSGSAATTRSGATFADAAGEYLRFSEQDRGCKPSTVRNYRNAINVHLLPVFGGDGAGGHHGPGDRAVARWDVQRSSSSASSRTRLRTTCSS